ncbi:MAG: Y-family DNA polymerase [Thermogutta sp.]
MTQRITCLTFAPGTLQSPPGGCEGQGHHPPSLHAETDEFLRRRDSLAEICLSYTPHVGLVDVPNQDCFFLDLTNMQHLIGNERRFVTQLLIDCHQRGHFPLRIALADTPGAAWAVAHFAERVANDILSFVWILPPGHGMQGLASLPVEALRIPDSVASWCHELGLHRIGDLVVFPPAELQKRFGKILVMRLEQLMGTRKEILAPYVLQPRFEEHLWLEHPAQSWEALNPSLSSLLHQLTQQLMAHNLGALKLDLSFLCEDRSTVTLPVDLFCPTTDPHHLSELIELGFTQRHFSSPVVRIDGVVSHAAPLEFYQATFFPQGETEPSSSEWGNLLERLSSRLGTDRVCYAVLHPDHAPEKAYSWRPCLIDHRTNRTKASVVSFLTTRSRPSRLFREPIPIRVITAMTSGVPYRIHDRGGKHDVVRWWGPERIQTGWWRGQPIARDYYRVELQNGTHLWIYRCLEEGGWFLHGAFG